MTREAKLGILGLILLLPAGLLVGTGLAGVDRPDAAVHPVLVLGGLAAAVALNLAQVLRIHFGLDDRTVYTTVMLRVQGTALNLAALALGGLLLGAITVYLLVENFVPRVVQLSRLA